MLPILSAASSCAARMPSLTAASTMSWSSSTSSGSTASGSIVIDLTTRSPVTWTLTIPPPAEASTTSSLSDSWAAIMSSCIFWACLSSCCMLGAEASVLALLVVVEYFLGVELLHQSFHELLMGQTAGLDAGVRGLGLVAQLVAEHQR